MLVELGTTSQGTSCHIQFLNHILLGFQNIHSKRTESGKFGNYRGLCWGRRGRDMTKIMKNAKIVTFVILRKSHAYLYKPYQYQHNKSITYCTAQKTHKY